MKPQKKVIDSLKQFILHQSMFQADYKHELYVNYDDRQVVSFEWLSVNDPYAVFHLAHPSPVGGDAIAHVGLLKGWRFYFLGSPSASAMEQLVERLEEDLPPEETERCVPQPPSDRFIRGGEQPPKPKEDQQ